MDLPRGDRRADRAADPGSEPTQRRRPTVKAGLLIAPFAAVALIALPIGLVDAIRPPSLRAQLVGLSYVLAGIASLGGGVALLIRWGPRRQVALLATGAAAYVWLTLAVYSYAYRRAEAVAFGLLLALTALAGVLHAVGRETAGVGSTAGRGETPGRAESGVGKLRVTAAAFGVLVTAAQLWYSSVYLPANVDVGIEFSVSLGNVVRVSPDLGLAPLGITLRNGSSIAAVTLTAQYTVIGLDYPAVRGAAFRSTTDALGHETLVGEGHPQSEQDLNAAFKPAVARRLLAVGRAAGDGKLLFPGVVNVNQIVVAVPLASVNALEIHVSIDYARETRLALAGVDPTSGLAKPQLGPFPMPAPRAAGERATRCKRDVVEVRRLRQSMLQRFTRGREALVTNWCIQPGSEGTFSYVVAAPSANVRSGPSRPGHEFVLHAQSRGDGNYGIVHTARVWTFPLSSR